MTSRLDIAFMGRTTARYPIVLKSPRRIEHDAKWRGWKDRAAFAGACLLVAAGFIVLCVIGFAL